MKVEDLCDKAEIGEVLSRYCHALDRRDWPAFRAVFTDDAELDFTAFGGPKGGVGDLEAFLAPVLGGLKQSQHSVSTVQVDLHGDMAEARSVAIVPMTSATPDGAERTVISGLWYEDHFTRTPAGWRIRLRKQVRGWASSPI